MHHGETIGNTTYFSDGTTARAIGNTTYFSDGTTARAIGNTTYFSDGTTAESRWKHHLFLRRRNSAAVYGQHNLLNGGY